MKLVLAALIMISFQAHGRGGTGSANGGFRNPEDLRGFCISKNQEETFYKQYCTTLRETIELDPCVSKWVEEMRLMEAGSDAPGYNKLSQDQKDKPFNSGLSCSRADGTQGIPEIVKDKDKYNNLLIQWFSMIAIQQSDWDCSGTAEEHPKAPDKRKKSIYPLKHADMIAFAKKFPQCGCAITNQTKFGQPEAHVDCNHAIKCGVSMAIHEAWADRQLFNGSKKPDPNDPKKNQLKGAAKIFPVLEDEGDDNLEHKKNRDWRVKKLRTYCEQYAGSKITKWEPRMKEIDGSALGSPKGSR